MNPFKLLSPAYLFDPSPGSTFMYFWPMLILLIAIFFASWKVKELIKKHRNPKAAWTLLGGIPTRMREFALLGLLLSFLRNENIPYLGMRGWIVLLFVMAAAYGLYVWLNYKKNYLKMVRERKVQNVEDQYIPKAKKKRKKKR